MYCPIIVPGVHTVKHKYFLGVYNRWTGLVDWTGGLDRWTGLDWTGPEWNGPSANFSRARASIHSLSMYVHVRISTVKILSPSV